MRDSHAPQLGLDVMTQVSTADVDELVLLAQAGAEEAGPYLVSLCGARLAGYARHLAPELSEAERDEVCERAVELAVRRIDRFDRNRGSFESWVRGFVRFVAQERRHRTV